MAGYVIGIDVGTTFTAAAVAFPDGRVEPVVLGATAVAVPTVLLLGQDGTSRFGEQAVRRALQEPLSVVRLFKRQLGDEAPIVVQGVPWPVDVLMSKVFQHVIVHVSAEQGGLPDRVVVTHPASWGAVRIELLAAACYHAGAAMVTVLAEPIAAAVHYSRLDRTPDGAAIAVYDLGGGTFDAVVLRKDGSSFEVLGRAHGLDRFGGVDLDDAVLRIVDAGLGGVLGVLDLSDEATTADVADLRARCVEAKESLSSESTASVVARVGAERHHVRITRAELEAAVRPLLGETVTALRRAIESSGVPIEEIDRILLVGGSSRIPLVSELLAAALGRPVAVDANPKLAVAQGAAAWAITDPVTSLKPEPEPDGDIERAVGAPAHAAAGSRSRSPRWRVIATASAIAALVAAGIAILPRDSDGDGPSRSAGTQPFERGIVGADDGSSWIATPVGLVEVAPDAESLRTLVPGGYEDAAGLDDQLVAVDEEHHELVRVGRSTGRVLDRIDLAAAGLVDRSGSVYTLATSPDRVWLLRTTVNDTDVASVDLLELDSSGSVVRLRNGADLFAALDPDQLRGNQFALTGVAGGIAVLATVDVPGVVLSGPIVPLADEQTGTLLVGDDVHYVEEPCAPYSAPDAGATVISCADRFRVGDDGSAVQTDAPDVDVAPGSLGFDLLSVGGQNGTMIVVHSPLTGDVVRELPIISTELIATTAGLALLDHTSGQLSILGTPDRTVQLVRDGVAWPRILDADDAGVWLLRDDGTAVDHQDWGGDPTEITPIDDGLGASRGGDAAGSFLTLELAGEIDDGDDQTAFFGVAGVMVLRRSDPAAILVDIPLGTDTYVSYIAETTDAAFVVIEGRDPSIKRVDLASSTVTDVASLPISATVVPGLRVLPQVVRSDNVTVSLTEDAGDTSVTTHARDGNGDELWHVEHSYRDSLNRASAFTLGDAQGGLAQAEGPLVQFEGHAIIGPIDLFTGATMPITRCTAASFAGAGDSLYELCPIEGELRRFDASGTSPVETIPLPVAPTHPTIAT